MTRVLIVDDKEENLYYLGALLAANGYEVLTARHGAEALLVARQSPPQVAVTDLLMPVMDGYTLLRHWKSDPALCNIPFLVYTATYTDPEDEELALNLGADAFILKPAEPQDFMSRFRAVLDRSNGAAIDGSNSSPPSRGSPSTDDETVLLREYNEALIRKLEQKTLELENTNRALQRDITARQFAEAALRESEAQFRQLAESIEDAFWLCDLDLRIEYVSPAYATIWGRSTQSLHDHPTSWLEAIHQEDRKRVSASLSGYSAGGWEETFRILRPDGSVRWVRSRAFPVRDETGALCRVAGISRDITEYRRLEDQFRQAQKMEAVGQLAGGVAHDFNNLLSVILSYASLALRELEPGTRLHSDIGEIYRAGERASDLTRQLLAFGRRQMLQPAVLELGRVVADMETMLRHLLGEDIELDIEARDQQSRVFADKTQVEQVVLNLAVNARDAMPGGGRLSIRVTPVNATEAFVATRQGLPTGDYVALVVTDSGMGMDAGTRERLFEPFFTTKERGKGTGLGLSTVYGIVKQSHGHVSVQSEPGAGATFEVFFPRTSVRTATPSQTSLTPPTTLRGSETILIVEDDDQVRETACAILRRHGYQVLAARNGSEAVALAEAPERAIHLLLTDVVMPGMSGRELAERLAQRHPETRVLFASGYAEDAIVHRGVLDPGIAFLQKPITPEKLLHKIREMLSRG
jgi:PAS domain S-box-containing protein